MHPGRTSGSVKLHSWVTTLGQQRTEAEPGRLGVLRLTRRSNGCPSVQLVHLYPPTTCILSSPDPEDLGSFLRAFEEAKYAGCSIRTSENSSLPLCESFRHVCWMTPKGAEDGLRIPRLSRWL